MLIIGLTGSIAMGKSSAARYLASRGLPLWSADEAVHELYAGRAAPLIEEAFPGTVRDGVVDRQRLSARLMAAPSLMPRLEAIIHPLVEESRRDFVRQNRERGAEMIVLDIPLLLEKKLDDLVDVILLISAPEDVQRRRALARPGMSEEKLAMIRSRQLPDEEKRRRAHFVVDSSGPFERTHARLDDFLESVQDWPHGIAP
jgi:dephospho-CoA kinase